MEDLITEVARIVGGERALVEECRDHLAKTYTSQVFLTIHFLGCDHFVLHERFLTDLKIAFSIRWKSAA